MPVAILLYVNRSGSTLLSRLISDACEGVFVFPEMGFVLDLMAAAAKGQVLTGDRVHRLIEDDPRRCALPIADARMAAICREHGTGDLDALLVAIATAAGGSRPRAILIKHEKLVHLADAIPGIIAQPRFLHIIRDPRAVASSMFRTPVPEKPGFDMARGSLLYAARHWRDYLRRVDRLARQHPVLGIRYEDLGEGRGAMTEIAALLGVRLRAGGDDIGADRRYRVAPIDRQLHPRVYDRFDGARRSAWQADLSAMDARLVEAICGATMQGRGYGPATPWTPFGRVRMLAAALRHACAMVKHAAGTVRHHARRGELAQAVRRHIQPSIDRLRRRRRR